MRRAITIILAISLLAALILSMTSLYSGISLQLTATSLTNGDLDELLETVRWTRTYKANEFDCSNMSALLCEILEEHGFESRIATSWNHSWVLVRTREGVQTVDAIGRLRVERGKEGTPLLVLHPKLAALVKPTGQYLFEEEQYRIETGNNTIRRSIHWFSINSLPTYKGNGTLILPGSTLKWRGKL